MKSPRRLPFILLVLLAACCPAPSETVANMPAPAGYIDDYAHVLTALAISDMEATARELHDKTRAQVFLVTINTLEGEPVETFANQLFAKWKIGEKKTDRGVLMLFAIKDRKRWIEIGYGLEPILNDAKVGDIGRDMVPALHAQNYDDATRLGLDKICTIVAADSGVALSTLSNPPPSAEQAPVKSPPGDSSSTSIDWLGLIFPLFWFGIICFIVIRAILRRRRNGIGPGSYVGPGTYIRGSGWQGGDSGSSNFGSSNDSGFSGGDGGSSGGGGAGGDW
jgi:uncharacterized protein